MISDQCNAKQEDNIFALQGIHIFEIKSMDWLDNSIKRIEIRDREVFLERIKSNNQEYQRKIELEQRQTYKLLNTRLKIANRKHKSIRFQQQSKKKEYQIKNSTYLLKQKKLESYKAKEKNYGKEIDQHQNKNKQMSQIFLYHEARFLQFCKENKKLISVINKKNAVIKLLHKNLELIRKGQEISQNKLVSQFEWVQKNSQKKHNQE